MASVIHSGKFALAFKNAVLLAGHILAYMPLNQFF